MLSNSIPISEQSTILVAEDDESQLILVHHFLNKNGYEVIQAKNGAVAALLFEEKKPDLVLLDAKMPVLDGFLACEKIRKLPGGQQVPIIMVTALSDDDSVDKAFEAGAEDYVTKPIHWAVLRQRIQLLLDRKQAEKQIQFQATHDGLTGLPNRTLFMDRLQSAILSSQRSSKPIGLMFIDLDRFKWINDELGHAAGDQLLQEVATRMTGAVRQSDTVARLGGDEFTVILADATDMASVRTVAEKILFHLQQPFILAGQSVTISGSIGLTFYPTDAQEAEKLLCNADNAMYMAKNKGRNQYCFYDKSLEKTPEKIE
ncbi:MAG: diguanylate cyclase [Magnetococcales bacterium]|nr:diguanylate cyclase [Magnetococcales bacterium]